VNQSEEFAVFVVEGRAKHVMATDQILEGGDKSGLVEGAAQVKKGGDVIGGARRCQLPK
jgi:hypothetical protein